MSARRAVVGLHSLPLLLAAALVACDGPPPPCDPLCDEALDVVEACLEQWGQDWGEGFGYLDAEDHQNWCRTFLDEQVELAVERRGIEDGRAWVAQTCEDQRATLAAGDCQAYPGSWSAWDDPP